MKAKRSHNFLWLAVEIHECSRMNLHEMDSPRENKISFL